PLLRATPLYCLLGLVGPFGAREIDFRARGVGTVERDRVADYLGDPSLKLACQLSSRLCRVSRCVARNPDLDELVREERPFHLLEQGLGHPGPAHLDHGALVMAQRPKVSSLLPGEREGIRHGAPPLA